MSEGEKTEVTKTTRAKAKAKPKKPVNREAYELRVRTKIKRPDPVYDTAKYNWKKVATSSSDSDSESDSESEPEPKKKAKKKTTTKRKTNNKRKRSDSEDNSPRKKPKTRLQTKKETDEKEQGKGKRKTKAKEKENEKEKEKENEKEPEETTTKTPEKPAPKGRKKKTPEKKKEPEKAKPERKKKPQLTRQPTETLEVAPIRMKPAIDPNVKLEIVFSFDTTGSMYEGLDSLREKIGELVKQLFEDIPGIRIGVIAHGDYEQGKKEPYVIKHQPFTTTLDDIVSFVFAVEKTYGGDWEEAYELALRDARTKFEWTAGHTKALAIIGDATPHTADQFDKIDWKEEVRQLVAMGVTVHGVQCNTAPQENADTAKFFKELTELGGGQLVKVEEFQRMKEVFIGMCYREAVEMQFKEREAEIRERVGKLQRQGSATLMLNEQDTQLENELSGDEILKIHNAIHDPAIVSVTVGNETHDIANGPAGCRFVRIGGRTYIQQDKQKDNKYAKMALEGRIITWICKKGRWGIIIDNEIVRS